ncbi:hypothetical protein QR680_016354 [Steinernema hermaphroditum]|uniref:7TM GPCR serpentine receptor class x (Srx) domain-containing protein n=1 Tax=Steinernema hermaphroditum TaxID=289476 RepID=A0AA39HAY7_9BILA|nr:hypothetical protein QR680_016354 [Steinernema hermaphroditum]
MVELTVVNGTEPFVYGSELQGRGHVTRTDFVVGISMWMLALFAIVFGLINIYVVRMMPMFQNSFGALWMTRTIGEVGANIVHVVYSAPVTIFQPKGIPPFVGIISFTIGLHLACIACVCHQVVSTNRMIAVCFPVNYKNIFTKRVTKIIIIYISVEVTIFMALYFVVPCSIIGYSPKFYEYVFIKCRPDVERNYSLAGTIINRACFCLCFSASIIDVVTLSRIMYITFGKSTLHNNNKNFKRDVRFFGQTSVQNLTMMVSCTLIVIANNGAKRDTVFVSVLAFHTLIVTHLNNSLALILFNPEVRNFLGLHFSWLKTTNPSTSAESIQQQR